MVRKKRQNQATENVNKKKPKNQQHGDDERLAYLTRKVEGWKTSQHLKEEQLLPNVRRVKLWRDSHWASP